MAEIQQKDNRNKSGGIRSKKLSTRVDLTPMVDLGFLLITFFIFTTTLSEIRAMRLIVPDESGTDTPSQAAESKTISLLLEDKDLIRYYHGLANGRVETTNYAPGGLRAVLQQKIALLEKQGKKGEQGIIVLIKPTNGATYRNVVAVLDEMRINNVSKYVLMDPTAEEKNL